MKLIFSMCLLVLSISSNACDVCGSGAGSTYLGLLPSFSRHFVGVRYQQSSLYSHLMADGTHSYLTAKETFRTAEIWGARNIGNKFRVALFIPFTSIDRRSEQQSANRAGLGDVSAIGYYKVLHKERERTDGGIVSQTLWAGIGAKLPTGAYDPEDKNIQQGAQNTFQLGTASVDAGIHALYDLRVKNSGMNVNASYRINTRNQYEYLFGNKFTCNLLVFHRFQIGKISIAPNTGFMAEMSDKDEKVRTVTVFETGGRSLMGTVGLEAGIGRIGVGANFQSPLAQELGEGRLKANERGMVYLSFAF